MGPLAGLPRAGVTRMAGMVWAEPEEAQGGQPARGALSAPAIRGPRDGDPGSVRRGRHHVATPAEELPAPRRVSGSAAMPAVDASADPDGSWFTPPSTPTAPSVRPRAIAAPDWWAPSPQSPAYGLAQRVFEYAEPEPPGGSGRRARRQQAEPELPELFDWDAAVRPDPAPSPPAPASSRPASALRSPAPSRPAPSTPASAPPPRLRRALEPPAPEAERPTELIDRVDEAETAVIPAADRPAARPPGHEPEAEQGYSEQGCEPYEDGRDDESGDSAVREHGAPAGHGSGPPAVAVGPRRVAEPGRAARRPPTRPGTAGGARRGLSRRHASRWAISSVLAGALAAILLPGIPGGFQGELAGVESPAPPPIAAPGFPVPPPLPAPIPPPMAEGPVPDFDDAPSSVVDLAGWKLTIPVANKKGTAAIIEPASSTAPWLTRNRNGSLTFFAPVEGATTANSEHARTELDSLTNFTAGEGTHSMKANLVVQQAPSDGSKIIIGQIHGADTISSVPYVMLQWEAGSVRVVVKQAQSGSASDKYPLLTGVPLNSRFSYSISDTGDGNLVFSATHGADTKTVTAAIPAPFKGSTVRFQAGAYQQGESGSGPQDGARLTFFSLDE